MPGLLAEVYIRLTRGQDALVVESHDEAGVRIDLPKVDLSGFSLPVRHAVPEECRPTKPRWPIWTRPAAASRSGAPRPWHNLRLTGSPVRVLLQEVRSTPPKFPGG